MKVIVATGNAGKMREFRRILEPLGFQVTSMKEEGIDVPIVEDGTTFAENARIKAMTVHQHTGEAVIADDSGICVDALGGRPGVYSARYGGEDLPHPEKIKLLLSELRDTPPEQRGARYEFGYDPIFYIGERSFAEYSDEEKDRISHRGKALRRMAEEIGRRVESGEIRVTNPSEKGE